MGKLAGSSGTIRACGTRDGCLGRCCCPGEVPRVNVIGAIIGKRRQHGHLGSKAPPTGKVHAGSAERFIYGAWGVETSFFIIHQDLRQLLIQLLQLSFLLAGYCR